MKTKQLLKVLLTGLFLLFFEITMVQAQSIELNGFAGYQLMGKAKFYDGDFRIDNAMNYGGKIALGLEQDFSVEFSYMRADTRGRFYPFWEPGLGDYVEFSSNYFNFAVVRSLPMGAIEPYSTLGIGWVWWNPASGGFDGQSQFQATFGLGAKIWLTDVIGIRIQGSMLMPMLFNGVGFGCGIGTGGSNCGAHAYTTVTPFQGEFSGGLVIRLSAN